MTATLDSRIRPAKPRSNVLATFPDGRLFEAPIGTPLGEIIRAQQALAPLELPVQGTPRPEAGAATVAVMVNGRLRDLTMTLTEDAELQPVTTADSDGMRIYRRSLAFLLMTAAAEVFNGADVTIEHSASTVGGYFCEVRGHAPFTQEDLDQIEQRMREIVEADEPFQREPMTVPEAMSLFAARGEQERVRLLKHREKGTLVVYTLRRHSDYVQGYMAASTGCLRHFKLYAMPPGFLLAFPHQSRPTEIAPVMPYPKLFQVFEEAGHWLDRLGIRNAGALNDAIAGGRPAGDFAGGRGAARRATRTDRRRHRGTRRSDSRGAHRRPPRRRARRRSPNGLPCNCSHTAFSRSPSASTITSSIASIRRAMRRGSSTTSACRQSMSRCSTSTS